MRLAELATVSNFELLKPPYVGVMAELGDSPFFAFFCVFTLACLIWTVPEQPSPHKKMRLAKLATVSNFERLKTLFVGVTMCQSIQSSGFAFFLVFFYIGSGVRLRSP